MQWAVVNEPSRVYSRIKYVVSVDNNNLLLAGARGLWNQTIEVCRLSLRDFSFISVQFSPVR